MFNDKTQFEVLKDHFTDDNGDLIKDLPETLDGQTMYHGTVKDTLRNWIVQGEHFLSTGEGKGMAKTAKKKMLALYLDLKDKNSWDKPMETISDRINNQKQNNGIF
ncbi:MAG: hypothetical protein ACJASM_003063 [Salibacteraceae bacterium]|jgi:hypothetical protein